MTMIGDRDRPQGPTFERFEQEERARRIIQEEIAGGLTYPDFVVALARLRRLYPPNLNPQNPQVYQQDSRMITAGLFTFDVLTAKAYTPHLENPVELTALGSEVYVNFLRNPGRIMPYQKIIEVVWGSDYNDITMLRTQMNKLKNTLGCSKNGSKKRGETDNHFRTRRGFGYGFYP